MGFPLHNQSSTPPPSRIGTRTSVGAARSNPKTSMKLDLPHPFGPTRTFRGFISKVVCAPNERTFLRVTSLRNKCASGRVPALGLESVACHGAGPPQLTGRFLGTSRADQRPELVSEKKTWPLKGMALHVIGELGM